MELIREIAKEFNCNGYYIFEVGGHVRDYLLGRDSLDIDLTTNAPPSKTKELVQRFGNVYDVGEAYGTIGLIVDNLQIEITTFRKEVYPTDSRKPNVEFNTEKSLDALVQDLARRDFTVNALAREPMSGAIIDPFNGQDDISAKIIRCVGREADRFNEDPLRMMRAVRFGCQLGFTLRVRMPHPERLLIVSKERIRDEFSKILLSRRASSGIAYLCSYGLMEYIVPDFMKLRGLDQGTVHHVKDGIKHSLMVLHKGARLDFGDANLIFRLACLFHDIGKPETRTVDGTGVHFYSHQYYGAKRVEKILSELRFDNDTIERVRELVYFHMSPLMLYRGFDEGGLNTRSVMRLIRKIGEDTIYLLLGLVKCDMKSSKNSRREFLNILTRMVDECMKKGPENISSPINGNEIMTIFGLKPSPLVGEIKVYLTELVIDGKLDKEDKLGAVEWAREKLRVIDESNGEEIIEEEMLDESATD